MATSNSIDQAFLNILKKVEVLKQQSLLTISTLATNFYRESFKNQGFTNQTLERWTPSLRNSTTLVRTGQLRNSIRATIQSDTVKIFSDRDYASYLNNGTTTIRKRPFIGRSITLNLLIKTRILQLATTIFK
jgi:phage gpG-like protein